MEQNLPSADFFESLAAACKFVATPQIDREFYRRHYRAIEMTRSVFSVLAKRHPPLEAALRRSLPLPPREAGPVLQEVFPKLKLSEQQVQWLDGQMTAILAALLPIVRDPCLPEMLAFCKEAIEEASHRN